MDETKTHGPSLYSSASNGHGHRAVETLSLQLEEIRLGLGRFKHHMQKEIYEQPEALRNAMRGRVKRNEESGTLEVGNLELCYIIQGGPCARIVGFSLILPVPLSAWP